MRKVDKKYIVDIYHKIDVSIIIGNDCPYNCEHCIVKYCRNKLNIKYEPNEEYIKYIVNNIIPETKVIHLGMGELFYNKYLPYLLRVLDACKEFNVKVRLDTSGSILDSNVCNLNINEFFNKYKDIIVLFSISFDHYHSRFIPIKKRLELVNTCYKYGIPIRAVAFVTDPLEHLITIQEKLSKFDNCVIVLCCLLYQEKLFGYEEVINLNSIPKEIRPICRGRPQDRIHCHTRKDLVIVSPNGWYTCIHASYFNLPFYESYQLPLREAKKKAIEIKNKIDKELKERIIPDDNIHCYQVCEICTEFILPEILKYYKGGA